jgi:uncharacterized protein
MSRFGVDEDLLARIIGVLNQEPKVQKVMLFGSRARGNWWSGSDIDLAVSAPGLSEKECWALRAALSGLPFIFKMDLLHLESLDPSSPLRGQIQQDAVLLWQAPSMAA